MTTHATTYTTTYKTTFPEMVQRSIGGGWVLVVKRAMDFCWYEPDMATVDEHVEWFHKFWWVENEQTRPKLIAFYDTKQAAVEGGTEFVARPGGHEWNWAVYNSSGVLVNGRY